MGVVRKNGNCMGVRMEEEGKSDDNLGVGVRGRKVNRPLGGRGRTDGWIGVSEDGGGVTGKVEWPSATAPCRGLIPPHG